MTETCRRCGDEFETDDDTEQLVCDRCLYLDWHESDDDLEEGFDPVIDPESGAFGDN